MSDSTEIATIDKAVIPAESPIVHKENGNVTLTALMPSDMQLCQDSMIAWAREKVSMQKAEAEELRESYELAKKSKWKSGTLKKHWTLAFNRITFYEKMLAALEAGFVIVPNFPISLFAIRTDGDSPSTQVSVVSSRWSIPSHEQMADSLPVGVGDYQNPMPIIDTEKFQDGEKTKYQSYPIAWRNIEFPVTMAKPEIMRATDRAMALKIFDQFGILPAAARPKGDPLIVAQLLDPRGRVVTFLVAWHLDTRVL